MTSRSAFMRRAERHLLQLASICVVVGISVLTLTALQDILVPFTLGLMICQLMEPVAFWLVKPRNICLQCTRDAKIWRTFIGRNLRSGLIFGWDIVVALIVVWIVLGVCALTVWGLVAATQNKDFNKIFNKYTDSPRVQEIVEFLKKNLNINITSSTVIDYIKQPLQDFVDGLLHFLETGFLTLLFLGFLLLGALRNAHPQKLDRVNTINMEEDEGDDIVVEEDSPGLRRVSLPLTPIENMNDNNESSTVASARDNQRDVPLLDMSEGAEGSRDQEVEGYAMRHSDSTVGFSMEAKRIVQMYLLLKTAMSVLVGVLVGLILSSVNVDFWFVFTVIAFLMNYIPTVGGLISVVAPMILVCLDPTKNTADCLVVFFGPSFVHLIIGNILEPNLFGSAFELHPVVVMIALVLWNKMWGVPGAILSVPLTCCIKVALRPLKNRHPYALIILHALEFTVPDSKTMRALFSEEGTVTSPASPASREVEHASPTKDVTNINGAVTPGVAKI